MEIRRSSEGRIYILHRPDGGFRRIGVGPDGRFVALDGADAVSQEMVDGATRLGIADDVFQIEQAGEWQGDD